MSRNNNSDDIEASDAQPFNPQSGPSGDACDNISIKKQKRRKESKGLAPTTPGRRAGLRSGVRCGHSSWPAVGPLGIAKLSANGDQSAAGFITLRCLNSERFIGLLRQFDSSRKALILKCEGSTRFQELLQHHRPGSEFTNPSILIDAKSPVDSAIDILTPETGVFPHSYNSEQAADDYRRMAPVRDLSQAERDRNQQVANVSDSLRDVVQNYYELQAQVQGYVSEVETKEVLINKVQETAQSLAHLARESSNPAVTLTFVPPEVVDYVDDGRNPDIYTRELVEVVQRGNAVLNGKMNAFGTFSRIFANDILKYFPEMAEEVNEIMGTGSKDTANGGDNTATERPVKHENGEEQQSAK